VVLAGTLEIVEATAKSILPVDLSTVQPIGNHQVGKEESGDQKWGRPGTEPLRVVRFRVRKASTERTGRDLGIIDLVLTVRGNEYVRERMGSVSFTIHRLDSVVNTGVSNPNCNDRSPADVPVSEATSMASRQGRYDEELLAKIQGTGEHQSAMLVLGMDRRICFPSTSTEGETCTAYS